MGKAIFITGTDTGVGKTLITGGIAAALRRRGIDVGMMKPAESGCPRQHGQLVPQDAVFLRQMAGVQDDLKLINPYALEKPLAPGMAAELEGINIEIGTIREAFDRLCSRHELLLVEGAGGLLVPLNSRLFIADLPRELGNVPVLLVVRDRLGTINHTLLSLHYAQTKGIDVLGWVMNSTSTDDDPARPLNAPEIQKQTDVPFWGSVPFIPEPNKETIRHTIENNLNLEPLLEWLGS